MEQLQSSAKIESNQYVYDRFESCMASAGIMRLLRATHVISELRERKKLLQHSPAHSIPENISTEHEDSTAWEKIRFAVENLADEELNAEDVKQFLVAIYLRALQLVTDFLENDRNISVTSPEQNLNRALNRLILLEDLETYLKEKYQADVYA